MKTAAYFQDGLQAGDVRSTTLFVVKENKNGTVDLAREEDGEANITGCRVVEKPEVGCCSIDGAKPAAVKKEAAKDKDEAPAESAPVAPKKKAK